MLKELVLKNRSYRRFYQNEQISRKTLEDLVELARCSPSAANLQPLKYILVNDPDKNQQIFDCLAWAAYLKDWPGPEKGERPSAYILVVLDKTIAKQTICDQGIAAQSILLGAVEKDLGGCILASFKKDVLTALFPLEAHHEVLLVLALGKPKEEVVLEEATASIKYWRDDNHIHHVPKRTLKELILE